MGKNKHSVVYHLEEVGILIGCICLTFGLYYLIGAFLANTWNPMNWINIGKIIYLLFSIPTFLNIWTKT